MPASGTYEIVFTPYPAATSGSFNVQAWESSRVTGTLTVGTANTYTSTMAGQVVQKTFSGTAGEQRGLTLSGFSTSVSGATLNVIVLKPDGTQLTNNNFTAAQTSPTAFVRGPAGAAHHRQLHRAGAAVSVELQQSSDHHLQWLGVGELPM